MERGKKAKGRYSPEDYREFRLYNESYNTCVGQSKILNIDNSKPTAYMQLWDKPAIEAALWELKGNEEGYFYERGSKDPILSKTKLLTEELQNLADEYELRKLRAVAEGREELTQWPDGLLAKRVKAEGRLDAVAEEIKILKQWLGRTEEAELVIRNDKMLQYGCLGQGRIFQYELVEIDFQKCGKIDGVLCITESESPYYTMPVKAYRKLCDTFCEKRHAIRKSIENQRNAEIATKGRSIINVPSGLGIKRISRDQLPVWNKETGEIIYK